jgi:predicted aspartyl protease
MAMLDTGFAGDLALPRSLVERLRASGAVVLSPGKVTTRLADGSTVENGMASAEASFPGCAAFSYVQIIVTDDRAVPLLGQDILSASASVNIDYANLRIDLRGQIWSSMPPCSPATCRFDPNAKPFFLHESPR